MAQQQLSIRIPAPFHTLDKTQWIMTIAGFTIDEVEDLIEEVQDELDKVSDALAETDENMDNVDTKSRDLRFLLALLNNQKNFWRMLQTLTPQRDTLGNGIPLVALAGIARKFRGHL